MDRSIIDGVGGRMGIQFQMLEMEKETEMEYELNLFFKRVSIVADFPSWRLTTFEKKLITVRSLRFWHKLKFTTRGCKQAQFAYPTSWFRMSVYNVFIAFFRL